MECISRDGQPPLVVFNIAQRFSWEAEGGSQKGKILEDVDVIPATFLQQLIQSWMKPEVLNNLPSFVRAGACQKAGEPFLSYLGLLEEGSQKEVAFPSLEERRPAVRVEAHRAAIACVAQKTTPFQRVPVRELHPEKYGKDDPAGDQLVNRDPVWVEFTKSPFPGPLPVNFVRSMDVVVYERTWTEPIPARSLKKPVERRRLYVALPVLEGIDSTSPLWHFVNRKEFDW